ncbi:lactate utilization protein [candidate division KSB1 bacterium]|nr:lactate utilization protein [candidate division KSB1 bacterium]
MNDARDRILQNLRRSVTKTQKTLPPAHEDAIIYRNYEPAHRQPLQVYAEKLAGLKGEFHHANDTKAAAKILRELASDPALQQRQDGSPILSRVKKMAARHRHPLIDGIVAADSWLEEHVEVIDRQKISSPDFADFAVGITAVDFLVARTGSLVLSSATAGGRRLSVLPPLHIAMATTDQLVTSLDEAMAGYQQRREFDRSSYATIITGPSRTSDIEKILVLGAHGPKRLAVIVVGENAAGTEAHNSN